MTSQVKEAAADDDAIEHEESSDDDSGRIQETACEAAQQKEVQGEAKDHQQHGDNQLLVPPIEEAIGPFTLESKRQRGMDSVFAIEHPFHAGLGVGVGKQVLGSVSRGQRTCHDEIGGDETEQEEDEELATPTGKIFFQKSGGASSMRRTADDIEINW